MSKHTTNLPLHDVTGRRAYCGPAAISAVTGQTTDRAIDRFKSRFRRFAGKEIRGTFFGEVQQVLTDFDVSCHSLGHLFPDVLSDGVKEATRIARGMTYRRWMRETFEQRAGVTFLVSASRHWSLVRDGQYVCGQTKRVVRWSEAPRLGGRIKYVTPLTRFADETKKTTRRVAGEVAFILPS
jgi:hypothetical protein